MVGVRGFEPPTPASRTQYSTRLSYTPISAETSSLSRLQNRVVHEPSNALWISELIMSQARSRGKALINGSELNR